jgi:hypothetical protein
MMAPMNFFGLGALAKAILSNLQRNRISSRILLQRMIAMHLHSFPTTRSLDTEEPRDDDNDDDE